MVRPKFLVKCEELRHDHHWVDAKALLGLGLMVELGRQERGASPWALFPGLVA